MLRQSCVESPSRTLEPETSKGFVDGNAVLRGVSLREPQVRVVPIGRLAAKRREHSRQEHDDSDGYEWSRGTKFHKPYLFARLS